MAQFVLYINQAVADVACGMPCVGVFILIFVEGTDPHLTSGYDEVRSGPVGFVHVHFKGCFHGCHGFCEHGRLFVVAPCLHQKVVDFIFQFVVMIFAFLQDLDVFVVADFVQYLVNGRDAHSTTGLALAQ